MKGRGHSARAIARELSLARNTVLRYLKSPEVIKPQPRPDAPGHLSRMEPPAVLQPSPSIDVHSATTTGQFSGKGFCNSCGWRCRAVVIERAESVGNSPRSTGQLSSGLPAATEA